MNVNIHPPSGTPLLVFLGLVVLVLGAIVFYSLWLGRDQASSRVAFKWGRISFESESTRSARSRKKSKKNGDQITS